ncbi:MAG: cytochrome c biogenesis protein ResB [Candidatus Glassbacteria bacterium]
MKNSEKKKDNKDRDISFRAGIVFLLFLFLFSNLYEGLFNRYLRDLFDYTWAVYVISLLVILIPTLILAIGRKEILGKLVKSVNLGVLLIIVVTVATILGTLIFQNRMPQEYKSAYGDLLFNLFTTLHMIDLFHSVWFVNILFILIVNLICCYIARKDLNMRTLGGYIMHFGIVVSLAGAFIGFVYGVKGVIQLNEGEERDDFIVRARNGPPKLPLGYEIVLDDFTIEWYEPKYLINTFRVTRAGGELLSSLNVEKKSELKVEEAGVSFEVVRFSENAMADGLEAPVLEQEDIEAGMPPYPIVNVMVEDRSLARMTRDEAKASGWLAAYDAERNNFSSVFDTDANIRFDWQIPEELSSVLEGKKAKPSEEGKLHHILVYTTGIEGAKRSMPVESGKAYRLKGTPYIVRVTNYYPNFKIDKGVPYSASDEPVNPAITVEITDTEHPDVEYRTVYLFARPELKGMMHGGDLPEGLELDYELHGSTTSAVTTVFIVGEGKKVYVVKGGRVESEVPIELGSPISFKASGHDLILSVQELYVDQPLCELIVYEGGRADSLVLSPLFSEPLRHERQGYVSTFQRERDILDYKSRVRVLENGEEVMAKTIEVNHPLIYGGYSIYQQSYNESDWTWTGFEVVRDPGLWVVYTGFVMMCIGSIYIFYIRPRIRKK